MNKDLILTFSIVLISTGILAQQPGIDLSLDRGKLEIAPSFNACSYYFYPQNDDEEKYTFQFRRKGENIWRAAFEAIRDLPEGIWKGSIFGLEEDADWQLRILSDLDSNVVITQADFSTWTSNPPIAKVVDLSKLARKSKGSIVISGKGKPDGWIKYTAPPGWVLSRAYNEKDLPALININKAKYIILENITIEGGLKHGIEVNKSEFVRITNCDISGWGRVGQQTFVYRNIVQREGLGVYIDQEGKTINNDAGVYINNSRGTVVERCYIHDPRSRANAWMFAHPAGPNAICLNPLAGGTVLRWNDMIGSDEYRWNDVIEGRSNSSPTGGFYRDSDIYGNYLAFANDDGVELEGGGMNVRFYHNMIEGTLCGISTGACILGPQFIFQNLVANPGDESGLSWWFFKNRHATLQGGKRYFINNTLYGNNTGLLTGYRNALPDRCIGFMRNNIFIGGSASLFLGELGESDNNPSAKLDNFDNDLFWIEDSPEASKDILSGFRKLGQETHGIIGDPYFIDPSKGDYHLGTNSIAAGRSAAVTNISSEGVDMGAFSNEIKELPHRPLALSAMPKQLNFLDPDEKTASEVMLTLPSSAPGAVKFSIRQNKVANWFKVSPSSGEIKPGESIKLIVRIDTSKLRGRPAFRGAFIIRTPNGLSRPVSVYAKAAFKENLRPLIAPNTIYIEAASLPLMEKFSRTTNDPVVSDGKYIMLNAASEEPEMSNEIDIATAGEYHLLLRLGVRENVDPIEFQLVLDGDKREIPFRTHTRWRKPDSTFKVIFLEPLGYLSSGKHRMTLKVLKGKINLNQIIVTNKPGEFFEQYWHRE
ncbi:MAG: right-handed parallel beta-helix repeat-containing protein [Chitinophagaceae bacterium]|nr:right-handed parallel beta-helix repeat-containing protein [Chitinophagaceae bacterium]